MAFVFKPSIWRGGALYELPRPVTALRVSDAWDYSQLKVPLAAGDVLVGHSRSGVQIAIEGQIGSRAGSLAISESAMFAEIEGLRNAVHVSGSGDKYEFFLYHDPGAGEYRKFKGCSTVRFEWDLSNSKLFTYSLVIHAEEAGLSAAGPGV